MGLTPGFVRTHRYNVEPADIAELLARREDLITVIRADHPGLIDTRLIRLGNGTFTDTWTWESVELMRTALAAAPMIPQVRATMSLTRDHTAEDGEILDQR
jgi:hypothetical protein